MARKHRLDHKPFTCSNIRYNTNIDKGKPHGPRKAKGSVFKDALVVTADGSTLWLEYVRDKRTGKDTFWLMWYGRDGSPTLPMSGEISADQIKKMAGQLTEFIKLDAK